MEQSQPDLCPDPLAPPDGQSRPAPQEVVPRPSHSPAAMMQPAGPPSGQPAPSMTRVPVSPAQPASAPARPAPAVLEPVEPPPSRDRSFAGRMGIAEWLLKHREYLLDQIEGGKELRVILADLALVAVLPTAFYGLVTGLATNSLVRVLSNPVKLPILLVFTMCLCLPTLYIFSSYLGSRRTFLQTAALGFTALAIVGVVLAAFAPITWFLTFTAPDAYALHVLVNVAVLALGGFMGVAFLLHGARRMLAKNPGARGQISFLWAWIGLYGLVGAQMGWLLRPFFSSSDVWIRARTATDETVFSALWRLLLGLLG